MDLLPTPGRVVSAAGTLAHKLVPGGLSLGRLTGRPAQDRPDVEPRADAIGANPVRRYGSASSRNLAVKK